MTDRSELTIAFAIIAIAGLLAVAIVMDYKRSKRPATIIERTHTASSTGVGVNSDGKATTVFHAERWELIVQDDDGNVYSISVSPAKWAASKPGERINDQTVERP